MSHAINQIRKNYRKIIKLQGDIKRIEFENSRKDYGLTDLKELNYSIEFTRVLLQLLILNALDGGLSADKILEIVKQDPIYRGLISEWRYRRM